jgi:hypothetical protein
MIRAGWKSLGAVLVWGTLLPVFCLWIAQGWKRKRQIEGEQTRKGRCRLCWSYYDGVSGAVGCPYCGAGEESYTKHSEHMGGS